jgi:hypothetical protein
MFEVFNVTFNYILSVSVIGGGERNTHKGYHIKLYRVQRNYHRCLNCINTINEIYIVVVLCMSYFMHDSHEYPHVARSFI